MQRRLLDLDQGKPHSFLVLTLFSWANVSENMGMLDKAQNSYQRSLNIERESLGANGDHTDIALTHFALAEVLRWKGDISQSERFYRKSIDVRSRMYNLHCGFKYHVDIAVILQGLVSALLGIYRNSEAE